MVQKYFFHESLFPGPEELETCLSQVKLDSSQAVATQFCNDGVIAQNTTYASGAAKHFIYRVKCSGFSPAVKSQGEFFLEATTQNPWNPSELLLISVIFHKILTLQLPGANCCSLNVNLLTCIAISLKELIGKAFY